MTDSEVAAEEDKNHIPRTYRSLKSSVRNFSLKDFNPRASLEIWKLKRKPTPLRICRFSYDIMTI
jgi:hypothetical protein